MNLEPISKLTRERPDLWTRALALATGLTGCTYAHKEPRSNGAICACSVDPKPDTRTPAERLRDLEREEKTFEKYVEEESIKEKQNPEDRSYEVNRLHVWLPRLEKIKNDIAEIKRSNPELDRKAAPTIFVPDGEMEWLLHEVGHWIAATPAERLLPNYGLQDDILGTRAGFEKIIVPSTGLLAEREWQAWGFEEIVLSPYGPSRLLASPTQRDGVAFSKAGPMPYFALHHAEIQMRGLGVDVEEWRSVYGEWARWSPWRRDSVH